jgi:hypothetical protein
VGSAGRAEASGGGTSPRGFVDILWRSLLRNPPVACGGNAWRGYEMDKVRVLSTVVLTFPTFSVAETEMEKL